MGIHNCELVVGEGTKDRTPVFIWIIFRCTDMPKRRVIIAEKRLGGPEDQLRLSYHSQQPVILLPPEA